MTMAWDPSFVLPATVRHVAQTPGRYLVRLTAGDFIATQKMLLSK